MSRFIDTVVAYRILNLLLTPIEKSEAYKLKLVDKDGKQLKKANTIKEQDAYTFLHKLIFKIKGFLNRTPNYETDLRRMATAGRLVNECLEHGEGNVDYSKLEERFNTILEHIDGDSINKYITEVIEANTLKTFKSFRKSLTEEGAVAAPANNAAVTSGVDGFTPETLGVRRKDKPKVQRRKKVN